MIYEISLSISLPDKTGPVGTDSFTDPYVISCEFNIFFAQVGSSLSKNITPSNRNPLDYIKGNSPPFTSGIPGLKHSGLKPRMFFFF